MQKPSLKKLGFLLYFNKTEVNMKFLDKTKPVTCYLASGWFNNFQEECRQDILKALNEVRYFIF